MQAHVVEYRITKVAKHYRQPASKTMEDHFALIADAKGRIKVSVFSKHSIGLDLLQDFLPFLCCGERFSGDLNLSNKLYLHLSLQHVYAAGVWRGFFLGGGVFDWF